MNTEQAHKPMAAGRADLRLSLNRLMLGLTRHWLAVFNIAFGIYFFLPWLAPIAMVTGLTGIGDGIYAIYSTQCHQMAQRSYFLFGQKPMYTLTELAPIAGGDSVLAMRAFLGNANLGWKVAWSDRMVSMWGGVLLGSLIYALLRQRKDIRPLGLFGFALTLVPMGLDGFSHMISDLFGLEGFRYTNAWLAALTHSSFPTWFYVGDALGSFNWWMRLLTGLIMGLGVVWFVFPRVEPEIRLTAESLAEKLDCEPPLRTTP